VCHYPQITLYENHSLIDLIVGRKIGLPEPDCVGLYALDTDTDRVLTFRAPNTILAAGGAGKVYLSTPIQTPRRAMALPPLGGPDAG
jgi:L-aspartate oxidase